MLLSQFPLTFHQTQKGMPLHPIAYENSLRQFHDERIPLNMVLLLQLLNCLSGSSFELMQISFIVKIRSSLSHLHGFQLLLLLLQLIETTFFVCTNRIILLNLKESSDRLVIVTKKFLKLLNLHMLIKQKSHFLETLHLGLLAKCYQCSQHGKSPIPHLFKGPRCCLLHSIKKIVC